MSPTRSECYGNICYKEYGGPRKMVSQGYDPKKYGAQTIEHKFIPDRCEECGDALLEENGFIKSKIKDSLKKDYGPGNDYPYVNCPHCKGKVGLTVQLKV